MHGLNATRTQDTLFIQGAAPAAAAGTESFNVDNLICILTPSNQNQNEELNPF